MRHKILEPGYTMIPNVYLDEIARTLTLAENLCLMHIMRLIFGWHRTRPVISLSSFCAATGLKRRTVCDALLELEAHGLIRRTLHTDASGGSAPSDYELVVESAETAWLPQAQEGVRHSAPPPEEGVRHSAPPVRQGGVRASAPPESPQAHPPHESVKKESEKKLGKKTATAAAAPVPESGAKGGAARAAACGAAAAAVADKGSGDGDGDSGQLQLTDDPDEIAIRGLLLAVPELPTDLAASLAARARQYGYSVAEVERMLAKGRQSARNLPGWVRAAIRDLKRFPAGSGPTAATAPARASPAKRASHPPAPGSAFTRAGDVLAAIHGPDGPKAAPPPPDLEAQMPDWYQAELAKRRRRHGTV